MAEIDLFILRVFRTETGHLRVDHTISTPHEGCNVLDVGRMLGMAAGTVHAAAATLAAQFHEMGGPREGDAFYASFLKHVAGNMTKGPQEERSFIHKKRKGADDGSD